MKRLILFRHARTERHAPSGEDFDRRLTAEGRDDARRMGKALHEAGFKPDLVLVSQAARAQETWELAKAPFPEAIVEAKPQLYMADAREILTLARRCAPDDVMVVGHNPAIHVLTATLAQLSRNAEVEAQVKDGFPTAAISVFELEGEGANALIVLLPGDLDGADA